MYALVFGAMWFVWHVSYTVPMRQVRRNHETRMAEIDRRHEERMAQIHATHEARMKQIRGDR